jgi:hypothetical protein
MSTTNRGTQRCILLIVILCAVLNLSRTIVAQQLSTSSATGASAIDPNKPSSERNHHIAGFFLIAIGLCSILGKQEESLAWLRRVPPILFIAAGLFLAAWSDDEIWPRGNLSWTWLLRHDAEARQHKIYALLLIALGLIEYAQTSSGLRRRWLAVVFAMLCVLGGVSLFFHQHSAMAAAPANAGASVTDPNSKNPNSTHMTHEHGPQHQHGSMPAGATQPPDAASAQAPPLHVHNHAEANVQRQHMWFAIIGFCVAAFKFLHDADRRPLRLRDHLWGSSVIVLGILLLLYTE